MFFNFLLFSLVLFAFHFFFHWLFLRRLAKHHSETYEKLSRPSIFTKYHLQKTDDFSVFMFDKEWKTLEDAVLERYNLLRQGFLFLGIALFALGFFINLK